jgi:hypothetical protein
LCGAAATEVTSLGCHTDLWIPTEGRPCWQLRRSWPVTGLCWDKGPPACVRSGNLGDKTKRASSIMVLGGGIVLP